MIRTPAAERGSIPLALLVIIALSAVIGALVVTTVSSSRAARFDQRYAEVVQAADTGAQTGAALIMRGLTEDEKLDRPLGYVYAGPVDAVTSDGIAYTYEAEKVGSLSWLVTGSAQVANVNGVGADEVARTVQILVEDTPLFFVAAFSDTTMEIRGASSANSYDDDQWYTGNGILASNSIVTIGGTAPVNGVNLYNWANSYSLDRCRQQSSEDSCNDVFGGCQRAGDPAPPGSSCADPLLLPDAVPPSARIDEPLVVGEDLPTAFIDEQRPDCDQPITSYTASTFNRSPQNPVPSGSSAVLGAAGQTIVYCFEDMTFDRSLDLSGPVEIYVYGNLFFGEPSNNDVRINCTSGCVEGTDMPVATDLTFYVDGNTGSTPSTVKFSNGSRVAAGIYAPESTCEGNPSNAQAEIFGSLICRSISNEGGWEFHYDDRLTDVGLGIYDIRNWLEPRT